VIDHFKCYKTHSTKFRASNVTVDDQFGSITVDIKKQLRLCVAADKNGEGILDPNSTLMCYQDRIMPGTPPPNLPAQVFTVPIGTDRELILETSTVTGSTDYAHGDWLELTAR
jgi:hypothetical protein